MTIFTNLGEKMRPVHRMPGGQPSTQLCRDHMKSNMSLGWLGAKAGVGEARSWWSGTRPFLPLSLLFLCGKGGGRHSTNGERIRKDTR